MAGCKWHDLKCKLKTVPVLGKVAKALDKPWQAATAVASKALAGTPLGGLTKALNHMSVGDTKAAGAAAAKGAMDFVSGIVPGLNSVPGVGAIKETVGSLVDAKLNIKKAGGAAIPKAVPLPPLQSIFAPGSALARLTTPTPGNSTVAPTPPRLALPPPPGGVGAVVASASTAAAPNFAPPQNNPRAVRQPRKFTKDQWAAFGNDPRTVGGTQVWAVP